MNMFEEISNQSFIDELQKIAGKNARGKRDGTGPYKSSFQQRMFGKGKRQMAGEKCPIVKK